MNKKTQRCFFSIILSSILLYSCSKGISPTMHEVASLFPGDSISVNIHKVIPNPRFTKHSETLKREMLKDPKWWRSYIKKAEKGKPLPYHKKMGLTEKEYREFLTLTKNRRTKIIAATTVEIIREDSNIILKGDRDILGFNTLTIQLDHGSIVTKNGELDNYKKVEASELQVPGKWNGHLWGIRKGRARDGFIERVSIGKMVDESKGIVTYSMNDTREGKLKTIDTILLFNLQ